MILSIICFFNNSLLHCTIYCQINIYDSESDYNIEKEENECVYINAPL